MNFGKIYTNSLKKIVFFDDLLRDDFWPAKDFFYDLIREPLKLACDGIFISESPRCNSHANLKSSFVPERFRFLALNNSKSWIDVYNDLPNEAEDFLVKNLESNVLYIGYELPNYLKNIFNNNSIKFVDIRLSPIRFASDIFVAMRSNCEIFNDYFRKSEVGKEYIKIEANLLKASLLHLKRYSGIEDKYKNSIIFLGQTTQDASLIDKKSKIATIKDFSFLIREICSSNKVYYKPHPNSSNDKIKQDLEMLENILNSNISITDDNIYHLFALPYKITFCSISSGSTQECSYFDKEGITFLNPICPLEGHDRYYNLHFNRFISPYFWQECLNLNKSSNLKQFNYPKYENQLRHLHNVWWGYSECMIKDKHFYNEIIKYTVRSEIDDLKQKISELYNSPILFLFKHILKKFKRILHGRK